MAILTLQPDAAAGLDNYLTCEPLQLDANYGTDTAIDALNTLLNLQRRILIEFDGIEEISGAVIISAIFTLTGRGGLTSHEISLHRVTQHWTEAGSTWNKYDGVNAWVTPGGDYDAVADATYSPIRTFEGDLHDFTITALVQEWVDGVDNEGMLLKLTAEEGGVRGLQCHSSDHATAAKRPKLVIEYGLPVGGYAAIF